MLADYFDKAGAVGRHGAKISGTGIIQLLCNEKIAGDMLLQKTHCIDPISKIHKVNHGEWTQYFVEGSHEGILDRETYKKVLAERARRVEALGWPGLYEEAPPVFQPDHLRGMREAFHAAGMGYEKAGQAGGMGMQDAYQERGQLQYRADPGAAAGKAGGGGHGAAEI